MSREAEDIAKEAKARTEAADQCPRAQAMQADLLDLLARESVMQDKPRHVQAEMLLCAVGLILYRGRDLSDLELAEYQAVYQEIAR